MLIGAIWAGGVGGYEQLDSGGWISHTEESLITAESNWFVGETKDCISYPLNVEAATAMHKDYGDATYSINCDSGPQHRIEITFYGKTKQPDTAAVEWRCTRSEGSFECKQTGTIPQHPENTSMPASIPADVRVSKSAAKVLCDATPDHKIHYRDALRYAELRKIAPADAGQELEAAGCAIVQ